MKIMYLAQRVPFPADRGDKIITFNTVRYLARRHSVSVYCLADGEQDLENLRGLESFVDRAEAVLLHRTMAKARSAVSLLTGAPFTLGFFWEPKLQRLIDVHLRDQGADLILVFSSGMASFVRKHTTTPRVIQFGDLDSQKWSEFAGTATLPMNWVYALEGHRLLKFEREIAHSFSHSIVCTPQELADFHRLIGSETVSCISNGVDLEHFRPGAESKVPGSIVFTGVMDYQPNVDAMCWFSRKILPVVQACVPNASLTICGSRPTAEIGRLASLPGVTVTGRVLDVVPYLNSAEVAVVPMRQGRGIQNKLLEAMSAGLPCVATPKGLEGAEVEPGSDLLVADSAEGIAEAVILLLTDADSRTVIGRNARKAMERTYAWERQLERLDRILDSAMCK